MSSSNWSSGAGAGARETVAAYFENSEDAQSAVNELVDENFPLSDIGAAVHSRSFASRQRTASTAASDSTATSASFPSVRSPRAGESGGNFPLRSEGNQDLNPAGATSDTEAVSPWGLFTGGGTPFAGASRPGPITGSEIPPDLPRELPSDLAPERGRAARGSSGTQNAGRWEYPYSGTAFETSFTGMGIPPEHARRLSRELRRGGAVVTVKAGAREGVAERILERNHGTIRYESAPPSREEEARDRSGENERVHVFGEIHRVYPGYVPLEDARERKAS